MNIVGESIKQGNVTITKDENITPTTWFPKPNLLPVVEWSPVFNPEKKDIIFSNGTDTFTQSVSLDFIEIKTTGFTKDTNDLSTTTICSNDQNTESLVTLGGSNSECSSSFKLIKSGDELVPFRYIKPTIKLSKFLDNLSAAPSGRYTANYDFSLKYLFKRANGVVSFRYIPVSVSFEIMYDPAQILDVIPHGDGVITPVYDKENRLISGETQFNVEVKGVFPDGIKLNFANDFRDNFSLNNVINGVSIPYYINCDACDTNAIVDQNGKLVSSDGIYYISSFDHDFDFNLYVGFKDIKAEDINSGGYRDTFYIYFEPNY